MDRDDYMLYQQSTKVVFLVIRESIVGFHNVNILQIQRFEQWKTYLSSGR